MNNAVAWLDQLNNPATSDKELVEAAAKFSTLRIYNFVEAAAQQDIQAIRKIAADLNSKKAAILQLVAGNFAAKLAQDNRDFAARDRALGTLSQHAVVYGLLTEKPSAAPEAQPSSPADVQIAATPAPAFTVKGFDAPPPTPEIVENILALDKAPSPEEVVLDTDKINRIARDPKELSKYGIEVEAGYNIAEARKALGFLFNSIREIKVLQGLRAGTPQFENHYASLVSYKNSVTKVYMGSGERITFNSNVGHYINNQYLAFKAKKLGIGL